MQGNTSDVIIAASRGASSPRMIVLGMDAADGALIKELTDEGALPTLGRLREEGTWVCLRHDGPIPSASVWPSIFTGTHPGKHGLYNGFQIEPGAQKINRLSPDRCGQPPFWRFLDENGVRSVVMDVPFAYALAEFRGTQILDWGTYERHYKSQSYPKEILAEISKRFGVYPFGQAMSRNVPTSRRDFARVRARLLEGARLKGRVIRWLMARQSWDFLMAVFSESHPAGHYFWNFHSNGRREAAPDAPGEFATAVTDIYRAIDEEIGKIIENLDREATLLVLSGQGMGPNHAKWHLIPELLSEMGMWVTRTKKDRRGITQTNWPGELRDSIPLTWRRSVSRYLPGWLRDYQRTHWATSRIDWAQTRAFPMPTDQLGYIRVNLKGREPLGIVEPGSEYEEVCERINEALRKLVDPRTGRRIVGEIFRTDQVFPGAERDRLPDLIVAWRDDPETDRAHAEEAAASRGDSPDPRAGNHRPRGFALLSGPGIGKGRVADGHILDIAPTALKNFGLTPPCDIDGRPWNDIFS